MTKSRILASIAAAFLAASPALAQQASFEIIKDGKPVEICVSAQADKGVLRAVNSLSLIHI